MGQNLAKPVVTTPEVRAELMAHAPQGVPTGAGADKARGQPVWVGLQLAHQPHWHTYWKNSGDSGLPTELQWTLPPGVLAGDIDWPVPKKIPIGNLANYGYEGTVLLPVPLTITPDFKPPVGSDTLDVRLKAAWLVCRQECIPQEGEFALRIPLRGSTALNGAVFDAALAARPRPVMGPVGGVRPDSQVRIDGDALAVSVQGLPVALRGKTLDFFPETPEVIATAAAWTQAWNGGEWTARVPLSPQRANSPSVLPVVLAADGQGWRAELKVLGTWPAVAAPATVSPALEAALREGRRGTTRSALRRGELGGCCRRPPQGDVRAAPDPRTGIRPGPVLEAPPPGRDRAGVAADGRGPARRLGPVAARVRRGAPDGCRDRRGARGPERGPRRRGRIAPPRARPAGDRSAQLVAHRPDPGLPIGAPATGNAAHPSAVDHTAVRKRDDDRTAHVDRLTAQPTPGGSGHAGPLRAMMVQES